MRTLAFTLLCLTGIALGGDGKPNFSGDWKMNPDRSSFGQLPRPAAYEREIDHREPVVRMTVRQSSQTGEQTIEAVVRTDGRETTNKYRGGEATTVAKWSGRDLELTTTREIEGGRAITRETWSLSEDGKTLTSITRMETPRGAFEIKMLLDKQ